MTLFPACAPNGIPTSPTQSSPVPVTKLAKQGMKAHDQASIGQCFKQPSQPSSCPHWLAMGTAVASWATLPKDENSEGSSISPSYVGPLAATASARRCCSSSPQTMRTIFSQCFNTSQLASALGRSLLHPARPDSRRPGQPHPPTLPPLHHCLSHCFSTASPDTPTLQSCQTKTIRAPSKVQELTGENLDIGNTEAPSNTHTFPQAHEWLA